MLKKSDKLDGLDFSGKIDIVLPFYNQHKLMSRCLRAVEHSGYREGRIIIVNDRSNSHDLKIIEDFCGNLNLDISLISHDTNKGFRESILTGISHTNTPYVILLNSDTVVTPDFASDLTAIMVENEKFGAVAPVSNHPTDLYQFRKGLYLKRYFDDLDHKEIIDLFAQLGKKKMNIGRWFSSRITESPYLSANCLALNRDVFDRAGYFYEKYDHGYFEDLDLSCSIRDLGYKLAVREDCFVFHRGQGSYKDKPRSEKEKLVWKNYFIFEARWGDLPEHNDLIKKMHYAGIEYPI